MNQLHDFTDLSTSQRSDAGVSKWIAKLGCSDAPVPHQNVKVALTFFSSQMPALPAKMAFNFLLAMDLSSPGSVRISTLMPPEKLIAFRSGNESPFKLFYARSGASTGNTGINSAGRSIVRFSVRTAVQVLESRTTGAIDVWTVPADGRTPNISPRAGTYGVMAAGGAMQLIVPNSQNHLVVDA